MASSKKLPPSELAERLTHFLHETVQPGQTLLVGLSGGLDSCVLLHLLAAVRATIPFQLRAVHVNHGISPNAEQWAEFCARLCETYDVPCACEVVHVPRDSGTGIEAAAREARYEAFRRHPADALVLAHHRDDQAETLLLQLLRGAGVKGMAAMPTISGAQGNSPPILRPLLDVSREALESYALAQGLQWIEDESNLDLAFDRNYLRHRVLPDIEQRFPAARTTLARSASHFAEAAALLDEVAEADAAYYIDQEGMQVEALRHLSPARGKNLLRFWLSTYTTTLPNTRRLQEIYRQLLEAREDAQLRIALEGGEVRRYRDHAVFARHGGAQDLHLTWQGEPEIRLPVGTLCFEQVVGRGLASGRIPERLEIRSRRGGERFRPDARRPTRSLRHLLQETGMPPWERAALPLIYLGDRLAVVPGIGVAADLQAQSGEEGWLIAWKRD